MKNKIEIKDNKVCKTYLSRMDFVKEENIYKKLKGTGLAPQLLDSWDGYLEHEYVEGENFIELLAKAEGDIDVLYGYFKMFFDWYGKFRDLTKMTLGQVRFEKFILAGDRLCNLDFEHTKPGYLEDDLARLVSQMCMMPEPFSNSGIEMARFFIRVGSEKIDWIPDILANQLPKALAAECKLRGVEFDKAKTEYITTIMTTAGVVFAGGETPLSECAARLSFMPQRMMSVVKSENTLDEFIGFEKVISDTDINDALTRTVDTQKSVNQVWTLYITTDMPVIPKRLWDEILSADKTGKAAVVIEARGRLREFPLLLRTSDTKVFLSSLSSGENKSVIDALSKLPILVLRLEDIK